MTIEEPDGTRHELEPESYHAVGAGLVCAFREPDPNCPNCHPERST